MAQALAEVLRLVLEAEQWAELARRPAA